VRSRPDIAIEAPDVVAPGERFTVTVTLTSHSDTPTEGVHLFIEELSTLVYELENTAYVDATRTLATRELVAAGQALAEATHRYQARLRLPAGAHDSQAGPLFRRAYRARVHVDIPLWPDADAEHRFAVVSPPPAAPDAPSPVVTTYPGLGGSMVLEVAVDDCRVAPGETLRGSLTFGNIGNFRFDGASLDLRLTEDISEKSARGRVEDRSWWQTHPGAFVSLVGTAEGVPVPFAIRVPRDLQCSLPRQPLYREDREASSELRWALAVRIDNAFGLHHVPLEIGRWSPRDASPGASAVPVGTARWRQAWNDQGAARGLALSAGALELRGQLHGLSARVCQPTRERSGLEASLAWRSWGFGLRVLKRRLGRGGAVRFHDHPEMDAFAIDAELPERARTLLGLELRQALLGALEVARVELDDSGLTLRSPGAAQDAEALAALLQVLERSAKELAAAALAMPPPPEMEAAAVAWRAFAQRRGGRFFAGGLRLEGTHVGGADFDLESVLDPRSVVMATLLRLRADAEDLAARQHEPAVRTQVGVLQRDRRKVSLDGDAVTLRMPGAVVEPEALGSTFADMQQLARLLRGERGRRGYR
jgi:hypothetical protein